MYNILKFGVYSAYTERDTAIQRLKNYEEIYQTFGRCVRQPTYLLANFQVFK